MKTLVDEKLREEAARFRLVYRCDDCAHFTGSACAHEWPTKPHRKSLQNAFIVFCKEFEA